MKSEMISMNKKNDNFLDELKNKFEDIFDEGEKEMNEFDNIIILNDEEGNDAEFEFLDLIEYEGEEYVVLLPVEETDEAGEVVILKLEENENDDMESYVSVDDDLILQTVFEIFKEKFKDEFNFVD